MQQFVSSLISHQNKIVLSEGQNCQIKIGLRCMLLIFEKMTFAHNNYWFHSSTVDLWLRDECGVLELFSAMKKGDIRVSEFERTELKYKRSIMEIENID